MQGKGSSMGALELLDRYTYDDYKKWEGRWELIDGIAYAMSPAPYLKHQRIAARIWKELQDNLECEECEAYIAPVDWVIDEKTVVQPDVLVSCEEVDEDTKFLQEPPKIVVEVLSLATALKDLTTKFTLYEKAEVLYYVVINPKSEELEIFMLKNGRYELVKRLHSRGEFTFSWDNCSTKIDFAKVF